MQDASVSRFYRGGDQEGKMRNLLQEVYFGTGKTFQPRAPLHEAAGGHQGQGALQ